MPTNIRFGGIYRDPSGCRAFKGSAWRNILQIQVYKGGAYRIVANFTAPGSGDTPPPSGGGGGGSSGSLTLSVTPSALETDSFASPITTDGALATPSGGLAPYTYVWAKLSGDNITVNSPASASTSFTGSVPADSTRSAIFRCTCTDSLGTSAHGDITVTLNRV